MVMTQYFLSKKKTKKKTSDVYNIFFTIFLKTDVCPSNNCIKTWGVALLLTWFSWHYGMDK